MNTEITENKRVIITGAAQGIGQQLARDFAAAGYSVHAIDMQEMSFEEENIATHQLDITQSGEIAALFAQIRRDIGPVHILINNAAIGQFRKSISSVSEEELARIIAVNLSASFICCKYFVEANVGAGYGRIINLASTRWHQNEADWEVYGMTKGGIVSMSNSLCVSLSGTGITVNAISPGWIQVGDRSWMSEEDHLQHPSGRVGKPEDITRAALFLASEQSDFINGINMIIDGGMTKRMIYH